MKIFTDKKSESESHSVVSNSCDPLDYTVHGILQAITGVGSLSLLQGIFLTQGLNPGLPHYRADSLPAEPPGKPKNTGVGSLSRLQQIFLTQNRTRVSCIAGGFLKPIMSIKTRKEPIDEGEGGKRD